MQSRSELARRQRQAMEVSRTPRRTYVRTHMLHPHILILSQTYSRMILQINTKPLLFAVELQLPNCYCTDANCLMKLLDPQMH